MSSSRKKIAVLGLGMMGNTHMASWLKRDDAEIVVVSDPNPKRLTGEVRAEGNVDLFSDGGFDLASVKTYNDFRDAIRDSRVEAVDICLPTLFHVEAAKLCALEGKPFLLEKPIARNVDGVRKILEASQSTGVLGMPALCLRFWPEWSWLKDAIDAGTYGKVLSARFERIGACPGGRFYHNGELCGGALLDLHIHDTDFILHCFGKPDGVTSYGYPRMSGEIDHVVTHYHYADIPLVVAEGGWQPKNNLPFRMTYLVNFENATAEYDLNAEHTLKLYREGEEPEIISVGDENGYDLQIAEFMASLKNGTEPPTATLASSLVSATIADAERESIAQGCRIDL
jgi:predicted dehydrogenase